jgi:2-C-methyl-D-erythritol 4-phosphate cytidylyltransferase/2-C-methyl-D-erythritol 2,4-cyclodiphosphate synthase|tara:strand:+ start:1142 stop:2296 length:1155 start_codon:yes stop_codon:yes gene_type:complete
VSKSVALIVAAGRGHRFGGEMPKQYTQLDGAPVLRHTVMAFLSQPKIDHVRVVIHPDDMDLYEAATEGLGLKTPIFGGEERQDSVRLGLQQIADDAPDFVLIHDGARPYISADVISRVLDALGSAAGAIPTLPLTDTIKRVIDGKIVATEDRFELWRAQTPQGFRYSDILNAHLKLTGQSLTDDAAICEAVGLTVVRVDGDDKNVKITTLSDIQASDNGEIFKETRSGIGFDVHRFADGDHVVLCGVKIAHTHSLEGHSDADVALHALTDALLGAVGEDDIGHFFPPSDEQWRGVASDQFVSHAVKLIDSKGGRIVNVDITMMCEAPKVGPYRLLMRERVATILKISPSRVNVKATTTEKLGFTGRGEGIAAQAIANVEIKSND